MSVDALLALCGVVLLLTVRDIIVLSKIERIVDRHFQAKSASRPDKSLEGHVAETELHIDKKETKALDPSDVVDTNMFKDVKPAEFGKDD